MNKKRIFSLLSSVALVSAGVFAQKPNQPNVIFILTDDLGYGDLGCYGSKLNRTPNIDNLAQNGIRFTDCYAAASISSPSRAALLTGRYPVRAGINGVFFPESFSGLDNIENTLPKVLQKAGYYTGIVGKWHLGHHYQYLPLQNGFNEYFGLPYSNDMSSVVYLRGNEVESWSVDQTQLTKTYTKEAINFIERHKEKPFFLYLAHNMPHVPIFASDQFKGKSANGLYGDVIEELDWSIGEIIKKIRQLGLEEKHPDNFFKRQWSLAYRRTTWRQPWSSVSGKIYHMGGRSAGADHCLLERTNTTQCIYRSCKPDGLVSNNYFRLAKINTN